MTAFSAPTLLLADPDAALRAFLVDQLTMLAGYAVTAVADAGAALAALGNAPPFDAALVDTVLDAGGRLTAALRAAGTTGPVIRLLAADDIPAPPGSTAVAGADGVLAKPLRLATVLEWLRHPPRAGGPDARQTLAIGPYKLDARTRALRHPDHAEDIRLTEKEVEILTCLHQAAGEVVSRETLLETVWGYQQGIDTHTVETHIYRLRRKIETDVLLTEAGGYRLASWV